MLCETMLSCHFGSILDGELVVVPVRITRPAKSVSISLLEVSAMVQDLGMALLNNPENVEQASKQMLDTLKDSAKKSKMHLDHDHEGILFTIPHEPTHFHPECTLLVYHHQYPMDPPYSYIATSKRPCYSCRIYFRTYNNVVRKNCADGNNGPPLAIRRSFIHHEVRWNCPTLGPPIDDVIRDLLIQETLKPDFKSYLRKLPIKASKDNILESTKELVLDLKEVKSTIDMIAQRAK